MNKFRIVVLEDKSDDVEACDIAVKQFNHKNRGNNIEVEVVICETIKEFENKCDNSFDGAIIDLNIGGNVEKGNDAIKSIKSHLYRIPVFVFTATPNRVDVDLPYVQIYDKRKIGFQDILKELLGIYNTGLTKILGGRGKIEELIYKVFSVNLTPQFKENIWQNYGEIDSVRTERSLLRYFVNHLLFLLDHDEDDYFPEEVYISAFDEGIQTGRIVVKNGDDSLHVILNPACDIVKRNDGSRNNSIILLVAIEEQHKDVISGLGKLSKTKQKEVKKELKNHSNHKHWLPKVKSFEGGFINFRKITTINETEFLENYKDMKVQISPSYLKDVIARFSLYYGRQGQPDIDFDLVD